MSRKITLVLFLSICLLMFLSRIANAEPQQIVAEGTFNYLSWQVKAPEEVKIGEHFSVTFNFNPIATLGIDQIDVMVYGNIGPEGNWDEWEDSWTDTSMHSDGTYTKTPSFTAVKEGGVYGKITAIYNYGDTRYVHQLSFGIAKIRSKTYEELENQYNSLNQNYNTLQNNYNSLETNLNNTRTLIYALIVTTGIFIATTIGFALRKPKAK